MYSVVFYITSLVLSCVLSTDNKRILYCIVSVVLQQQAAAAEKHL